MANRKLVIKFRLQDEVFIKALELNGKVKHIIINNHGISYFVRYFWNSEAKECYFYEDEIVPRKK